MIKLIEVCSGIYIRGHTRYCDTGRLIKSMIDANIRTVVNVALICDTHLMYRAPRMDIKYVHEPLHDSSKVEVDKVTKLIRRVVKRLKYGSVLIHCDSGWNRSVLIAVPVAFSSGGLSSTEDAISVLRRTRPKVLKNRAFEKFVLNWDTVL